MSRILIADGYPAAFTASFSARGGRTSARDIFPEVLARYDEAFDPLTLAVAEGEALPQGVVLEDFDGIAITGSPLSAYHVDDVLVSRQIEFARAAFYSGVPVWGSCWGIQIMSAALGGSVRLNPAGYEVGIARNIGLADAGRDHPLYRGKGPAFDAVSVHHDEIETVPSGAVVLAANAMSAVQAMVVEPDGGCSGASFWGVQYHPEFDLAHIAFIMSTRVERLVAEGLGGSREEVLRYAGDLATLAADPTRRDLAWRYAVGADVLDAELRTREFRNWLAAKVRPRAARRAAAV